MEQPIRELNFMDSGLTLLSLNLPRYLCAYQRRQIKISNSVYSKVSLHLVGVQVQKYLLVYNLTWPNLNKTSYLTIQSKLLSKVKCQLYCTDLYWHKLDAISNALFSDTWLGHRAGRIQHCRTVRCRWGCGTWPPSCRAGTTERRTECTERNLWRQTGPEGRCHCRTGLVSWNQHCKTSFAVTEDGSV